MYTFDETQLPSRLKFYNVKTLEMEKFRFKQLTLISSSLHNKHLGFMVNALRDVIKNMDVNLLTQGDFYYLLAYQRINSYSKPIYCHWTCMSETYIDVDTEKPYTPSEITDMVELYELANEEEKKELLDPNKVQLRTIECGHSNSIPVNWKDVQTVQLEDIQLDSRLDIPRVNTLADSIILASDPELGNIVPAAIWVKEGDTLEQKIEVLRSQDSLELFEIALMASSSIVHGIRNRIHKNCEKCGAGSNHIFEITPSLFFLV